LVVKDQSTKIPLFTGNACRAKFSAIQATSTGGSRETHRTIREVKAPNEFGRGPVKVLYDRSLPWMDV